MKRIKKNVTCPQNAGFTLVEIMFAIMIVALLTGLAAQSLSKSRKSAHFKEAEVQIEIISSAIRQLAWDTGHWPNKLSRVSASGLNAEVWDLTSNSAGLLATDGSFKNWQGPYLPAVPLDPWGNPYFFDPDYMIDGVNMVVVGSLGPNRTGANRYDEDNIFAVLQGQSI
jgi:general secretion pathway protein G